MVDYLEVCENKKSTKIEKKKYEHKDLYNEIFRGTAKLWKVYDSNTDLIDNRDFGRVFLKNGKASYYEIFEEPRTNIIGLSNKISILYSPLENDLLGSDIMN